MPKIGLLSDTHGHLPIGVFDHFVDCDEIWHAGDFGTLAVLEELEAFKPLRGVYGNIDGAKIRRIVPEHQRFECAGMQIWMTHIGGYPGRYDRRVRDLIRAQPPQLFISGHSHILKVMPDPKLGLLHINPGACGNQGWHKVKTLVRFTIEEGTLSELQVIELGPRSGRTRSA